MGALWTGQILIAGRLSDASAAQGLRAGVHMEDVMLRPEFLMGNAALTAECAIARLIDESDRALMDSAVLVCGWGRIGRLLALRLAALGAAVTVAARSRTARAEAAALGLGSVDYVLLETEMSAFDFVVNTVPARVLTDAMLCMAGRARSFLSLRPRRAGLTGHSRRISGCMSSRRRVCRGSTRRAVPPRLSRARCMTC